MNHWLENENNTELPDGREIDKKLFSAVFPRQFRFLFTPSYQQEMKMYVNAVNVDAVRKQIELKTYEMVNGIPYKWIERCLEAAEQDDKSQNATITFQDGCGTHLYGMRFEGLKLIKHKMPMNYASSDLMMHYCTFSYDTTSRI